MNAVVDITNAAPALASGDIAAPTREGWEYVLTGTVVAAVPGRTRLRVTGTDAQRWLNGMVTNNVAELAQGMGNYSFLLSNQGRIQGDLMAFRTPGGYCLDVASEQAEAIAAWLDRYIIMDDVEVSHDPELPATVCVAGRTAGEMLTASGAAIEGLPPLELRDCRIAGHEARISQDDNYALPVYWVWATESGASDVVEELRGNGAHDAEASALQALRIVSGIPKFGVDITARDLPQETSQARALHFQKGCYLGQEIVERIHSRGNVHRGLAGFELPGQVAPGTAVMDAETEIGLLTSVAVVPHDGIEDRTFALGIVRQASLAARRPLTAAGSIATHTSLPWMAPTR